MEAFENLDALDNQNQIEKLSDFSALKIDNAVSNTPIKNEPVKPVKPTNKKETPEVQEGFGTTLGGVIGTTGSVANTGSMSQGRNDFNKLKKHLPGSMGIVTPEGLWESEAAIRQSNWSQAGNATLRVLGNIVPETIQQASRMLDFSGDYSSDNAVGAAMQKLKDTVNEATPIFRENPGTSFDFGDFAYWAEQGSGLVTSAAAFAALGYATGGLAGTVFKGVGTGARLGLGAVDSGASLSIGARVARGIASNIEPVGAGLSTTILLTKAEGVGVGIDTYQQKKQAYIEQEKAKQDKTKKTDAQIEVEANKEAAKAAAFAYNMNQMNILLNLTSSLKFLKPSISGSRLGLATDNIFNSALNTAERTGKQQALHIGKELLLEGGQEGLEELVNYTSQQRAVEDGYKKSFSENFKGMLKDAGSEQGLENAFWGVLGGLAQTGFTKVGSYIPMYNNTANKDAYNNAIGTLQKNNEKVFNQEIARIQKENPNLSEEEIIEQAKKSSNILSDEDIKAKAKEIAIQEAGEADKKVSKAYLENFKEKKVAQARKELLSKYGFNSDGTSSEDIADLTKASDVFKTFEEQMQLYDEHEDALQRGDQDRANEIASTLLTNQIQKAFKTGTANTLEAILKATRDLTPKEAVERGIAKDENDTAYKQQATKALNIFNQLEAKAFYNQKYLNSDDVNEADANLITYTERKENADKEYNDYRRKTYQYPFQDEDRHINTPFINTISEYRTLSATEREARFTPEERAYISKREKELEEEKLNLFNKPTAEELNNDSELARLWNNKFNADINLENAVKFKQKLISKETQEAIKDAQLKLEQAKIEIRNSLIAAKKQQKAEEDNIKKVAKKQTKLNKEKEATAKRKKESSTPKEKKTEVKTVVTKDEKGNPVISPVVTETAPITTTNKSLNTLIEILGEDNSFIQRFKPLIDAYYTAIQEKNKKVNTEFFDKKIETLLDLIINTKDKEKDLLERYPDLAEEYNKEGSKLPSLINSFFRTEALNLQTIKATYGQINTLVDDLATTALDSFEEELPEEELNDEEEIQDNTPVDLVAKAQETTNKKLNLNRPLKLVNSLLSIIDSLNNSGITINSFDDLLLQMTNATDEKIVNSILPKLISTWNFIIDQNKLDGVAVDSADYASTTNAVDIAKKAEEAMLSETWTDNKDNETNNLIFNIIDEVNETSTSKLPTVVTSGTGAKSISSFNIAYLAKNWVHKVRTSAGVILKTKTDEDDGLNPLASYMLLDPDKLPIGTNLTLLPLNINERHSYYEKGQKVEILRLSENEIRKDTYTSNGVISEVLPASTHCPIFISLSSKTKDIIPGAFLHDIDWITSDNIGGDESEVQLQKQLLQSLREKVIFNLDKNGNNKRFVKVKIANTSMGVPLTSKNNFDYTNKRLTNNVTLGTIVGGVVFEGLNRKANYHNNFKAHMFKDGTVVALLPVGKQVMAIPLSKQKIENLADTSIRDSILNVIDLHFTGDSLLSGEQRKQKEEYLALGLDVTNFEQVRQYLNTFLYTDLFNKKENATKDDFTNFLNNADNKGTSVFRFAQDQNNSFLQFGVLGSQGEEITKENYADKKDSLLAYLSSVLDNSYTLTNLSRLSYNKKILGLVTDEQGNVKPGVLFKSYKDLIKATTSTNLQPAIIENPKTGKQKTIYTIQRTINLSSPINTGKRTERPNNNTNVVEEAVVPVQEETPIIKSSDLDDFLNDDLYSFETENEEDASNITIPERENTFSFSPVVENVDKLEDKYTFINGINSVIQNSIIKNIKHSIENAILAGNAVSIDEAIDNVFKTINDYQESLKLKFENESEVYKQKNRDKFEKKIKAVEEKIVILKENKDKLKQRTLLTLAQEKIVIPLKGKDKIAFLKKQKELLEKQKEEEENKELGIQEEEVATNESASAVKEPSPEESSIEIEEEIEDNPAYEASALGVNPVNSLSEEVRRFFFDILEGTIVNGEFKPNKSYLGLNTYVPFNTVYQKVQELLAVYPNQSVIKPTFENYLAILDANSNTLPYLKYVVQKLKEKENDSKFKQQFVQNMYKMYNNTNILFTKYDVASNSYISYLINTDSSNYISILKDEWLQELNANNSLLVKESDTGTEFYYKPEVLKRIKDINSELMDIEDLTELFGYLGITFPPEMLRALEKGELVYNSIKYNLSAFLNAPFYKNIIKYIIGNSATGQKGIGNLAQENPYGDNSFSILASMISLYRDNLTSNSSRNLNGDMEFNYNELKNVVDSFNKIKGDLPYLTNIMKDYYTNIKEEDIGTEKEYKTWIEQLLTRDAAGNIVYNTESPLYKVFSYITFQGGKIKDASGTDVIPVENYTTLGYTNAKLNLFLNQGNFVTEGDKKIFVSHYHYFTMSDKKVPIAFTAPSYSFVANLLNPNTSKNIDREVYNNQIEYLFKTLVEPDIQRMLSLGNGTVNDINNAAYSKENLKFYTLPELNLINFNYIDGDVEKGLDESGSLKKELGINENENLFELVNGTVELNINVLNNVAVQEFIKNKMKQILRETVIAERQHLIDSNILTESSNGIRFNKDSKISLDALIKRGYTTETELSKVDVNTFLVNYVLNNTVTLAQMQQLFIGDPLQFAKNNDTYKKAKEKYNDSLKDEAKLRLALEQKSLTEQEAISKLKDLIDNRPALEKDLRKTWALDNVLTANDNQGKRLAGDNASGNALLFPPEKANFNVLVIDDNEIKTSNRDVYYELLVPAAIQLLPDSEEKTKQINKILYAYDNINQADAQELTTLREHLDLLIAEGVLDEEEALDILKRDNEGNLSLQDYSIVMQPMKLVYSNTSFNNNINSRTYIKSSSFPLTKTFTKGMPIDDLRVFMEKNQIQRVAFKSAVKVGSPKNLINIVNADGTFDLSNVKGLKDSVINLPREGYKKQQNIPYDESKHEINDGTQKAKLLFMNVMKVKGFNNPITNETNVTGKNLYDTFINQYREYYKIKQNELEKELYPNGKENGLNYKKLQSIILEEARSRGFSENDMLYFDLNKLEDGFEFPLWLSNNNNKLASLLNSIVDNRIRKRKREGKSLVLLSDVVLNTDPKYKSNITYISGERKDHLQNMRKDENGNWLPAEIVVPFNFRDNKGNLLDIKDFITTDENGNTILDSTKVDDEVLEAIGFRIPTQGFNSMAYMKIVGFLPKGIVNTIIAPREFIAQMGSDFDIDKLYNDFNATIYEDGKIRKLNNSDLATYKRGEEYKNKLRVIKKYKEEIRKLEKEAKEDESLLADNTRKINTKRAQITAMTLELEKERKGLSQHEYLANHRNLPKKLELKVLENNIFAINKAVLSSTLDEVQKQRVESIDNSALQEIKEEIANQVYSPSFNKGWTPYTDSYQTKKYLSARGGKTGVSGYSSDSILNVMLQTVTHGQVHFQYYDKKQEQWKPNIYSIFGRQSNSLNSIYDTEGKLKSNTIQALQSISVDNENLQLMYKINMNDETADFIRAAVQLGFTSKDVFYIINHPVVKNFVKAKQTDAYFEKPTGITLVPTSETNENGQVKYVKEKVSSTDLREIRNNLTHEKLLEDITNDNYDVNSLEHYAIFDFFSKLTEKGKELKTLQGLLNVDSKGLGTNLFYSLAKEDAIKELVNNRKISNITSLLGDFKPSFDDSVEGKKLKVLNEDNKYPEEYHKAKAAFYKEAEELGYVDYNGVLFKANNIPSLAISYALITNNAIWSREFPYKSPIIHDITNLGLLLENNKKVDKLKQLTNVSEDEDTKRTVTKDGLVSISIEKDSELQSKIVQVFNSFLFSSISDESASKLRKELFSGDLFEIVKQLKNDNSLKANTFIKRLKIVDINGFDSPIALFNIEYDATGKEPLEENNIVNDIILLLKNDNTFVFDDKPYKYSDIMKQLILHQMLTGGVQYTNQFVKHIPVYYLKELGLYRNIYKNINKDGIYERFREQYIQHNPNLVNSNSLAIAIKEGVYKTEGGILKLPGNISNQGAYISYLEKNGNYKLFKQSASDSNTFIQIPTLGKKQVLEYDINAEGTISSVFSPNNPSVNHYNDKDNKLERLKTINKTMQDFNSYVNSKLALGKRDNKNPNGIVYKCD